MKDDEEYVLPPVVLPRIPEDPNKDQPKLLLDVADRFQSETIKLD